MVDRMLALEMSNAGFSNMCPFSPYVTPHSPHMSHPILPMFHNSIRSFCQMQRWAPSSAGGPPPTRTHEIGSEILSGILSGMTPTNDEGATRPQVTPRR